MSRSGVTRKLGEAHYFLGELQDKSKKAYKGERDHKIITYLFSAFANASYGVLCALRKTVKKNRYDSFLREWKEKSLSEDERVLFELMYAERRNEVHEVESGCSAALESHIESRPEHPIYTVAGANESYTVPAFEKEEIDLGFGRKLIRKKAWHYNHGFATIVLDHTYDEIEGEQIQAVENCTRYLKLLERLCSVFPQRKP